MIATAMLAALAACGGGGGGGGADAGGGDGGGDPGQASATLQWTASSDSRVVGYRVYTGTRSRDYDQAKGRGLDAGATPSYTVEGLASGSTYFFAVTAYDADGVESDYSSEASKTVP